MAVEERDGTGEPGEKGSGMKILIILIIFLIVLLGVTIGGIITYNKILAPSLGLTPLFGASEKGAEKESIKEEVGSGTMFPVPPFIVNLADTGGNRFIKVTVQLELGNKEMVAELERKMPKIQDQIITVLSSKKLEEVITADGKFRLKAEMMARMNQFMRTGAISNIYYTEFVVQ